MIHWIWALLLAVTHMPLESQTTQQETAKSLVIQSVFPDPSGLRAERAGVTREDLRMIGELVPDVSRIVPVREVPRQGLRVADRSIEATLVGTTAQYHAVRDVALVNGRFLTDKDESDRNNVVVIDIQVAKSLFADRNPIGRAIFCNRQYFTVVGVIDTTGDATCVMPFTTMQSRLGDVVVSRKTGAFEVSRYELSQIHITLENRGSVFESIRVIQQLLAKNHPQKDYRVIVNP